MLCEWKWWYKLWIAIILISLLNYKNDILWNNIKLLFSSLQTVHIQCIKKIHSMLNGFKHSPSFVADDAFMDNIFRYLSNITQKSKRIDIFYPINSKFDIYVSLYEYHSGIYHTLRNWPLVHNFVLIIHPYLNFSE